MSTQLDTVVVDLDRTDELPILDVDAYEASFAANDKNLSRANTWTLASLRLVDECDDASKDAVLSASAAKPSVQAESLTANLECTLRRITQLEAEIVASHQANETLQHERDAGEMRIKALEADNARLREDRAHSDATAQRLEQQLRERGESTAVLEQCLSNAKDIATHLSQQLGAKLADCEKAGSIIEVRNRTIEDLIRQGADLDRRLQQETAASADLAARLAVAEESLRENHSLLIEQDGVIANNEAQLVQAQSQIQRLIEERDALLSVSAQLNARAADFERKDVELAQLRGELVAAWAEAQSQTKLLSDRMNELDTLRDRSSAQETAMHELERAIEVRAEQAEDLTAQLRAALDERTKLGMQLDKARARERNLTGQIFSRDNQISSLQEDLAMHMEALATIRRDNGRIGNRPDTGGDKVEHLLEPVEHEGPTHYLTGEVLTVGRTSDNDISIPSTLISRCHARLLVGPTGVIIEDVNSTNGCYVNGEQVRQHLLRDGDVLELGDMRYRLRTRGLG
jgi:chromosome segregation ATPase